MAISKENREFIAGLIDYYVSTAASYRDLARVYRGVADSVDDAALGMIAGSVYSSFMQVYQNQQIAPSLEDVNEFNEIMRERAPEIKRAVGGQDSKVPETDTDAVSKADQSSGQDR